MRWNVRFPKPFTLLPVLALVTLAHPVEVRGQVGYPRPYPGPYGYRYAQPESDLRLAVTPHEAQVYVDGYLAGTVDEFDGVFQRLHLTPGEHELTFYLQGYRTANQRLYLSPNATRKITVTMEKLGGSETSAPPPEPPAPQEPPLPPDPNRGPPRREPFPRGGAQQPPRPPAPPDVPPPPASSESTARGGAIVLRVQPAGAEVRIDGERWAGPSSVNDRLVVQLSEGRHRIEVTRAGYVAFSTEVDVRRGESLPVNVSLARERQN